jgi:hypothetical protein
MPPFPLARTYPQDLRGGKGIKVGRSGATLTVGLDEDALAGIGGAAIIKTATVSLAPWSAFVADGVDECRPADISDPAQRQAVLAITANGGAAGARVTGQSAGDLFGPNAGWMPGAPLYVGTGGVLTQAASTSGWRQQVATVVTDGHIVVNLGEARIIAADTPMLAAGGFAAPAATSDVQQGIALDRYLTPARLADVAAPGNPVGDSITALAPGDGSTPRAFADKAADFPFTPYDFISSKADRAAVRAGANAPDTSAAMQAWLSALVSYSPATSVSATIPAGEWSLSKVARAYARSAGAYRTITLYIDPGAKLIAGPTNTYRYKVLGSWDVAANPGTISSGSGQVGDAYVAISAHDNLSIDNIKSLNVGDTAYRGALGWQKILAKPKYRMQSWDASTNKDDAGNTVLISGVGEEGDTIIVARAGNAIVDGVGDWGVGDEAYFCYGAWRKKRVRGGTFRGAWDPNTRQPALNNANGSAGDWYVVISAGTAFGGVDLGNGSFTGLGNNVSWQPGDKVWCLSPGVWHRCFASPTPQGTITPDGRITERRFTTTNANGATNKYFPPDGRTDWPFAGQGAYGDTYTITEDVTIPGVGSFVTGTQVYFGPNGLEVIAADPNWNRGLFHLTLDEKTAIYIEGRFSPISRINGNATPEISNGIALRVDSRARPAAAGYLFQGSMFSAETYSECDHPDQGQAQVNGGNWETVVQTNNIFLPIIRKGSYVRTSQQGGATRAASLVSTPRFARCGIELIDSYLPQVHLFANGCYETAVAYHATGWDVQNTGIEGGEIEVSGAGVVDFVSARSGYRGVAGLPPTLRITIRDAAANRYLVRIHGRSGTILDLGVPILCGTGGAGGAAVMPLSAGVLLVDTTATKIVCGLPSSGYYTSDSDHAAVIRTRGICGGLTVHGLGIDQLTAGVLFDLQHNGNGLTAVSGQNYNHGFPLDPVVTTDPITGYIGDKTNLFLARGLASLLIDTRGPQGIRLKQQFASAGRVVLENDGSVTLRATYTGMADATGNLAVPLPGGLFSATPHVLVQSYFNYNQAPSIIGNPTKDSFVAGFGNSNANLSTTVIYTVNGF